MNRRRDRFIGTLWKRFNACIKASGMLRCLAFQIKSHMEV